MAVTFVVTNLARRDKGAAVGGVNRETVQRDRSSEALSTIEGEPLSGRDVERAAALEWRGDAELAPRETAPPAARAPLDPEVVDVTRRQFLNRGVATLFGVGLAGFGGS